jgi:hypothetical protein
LDILIGVDILQEQPTSGLLLLTPIAQYLDSGRPAFPSSARDEVPFSRRVKEARQLHMNIAKRTAMFSTSEAAAMTRGVFAWRAIA